MDELRTTAAVQKYLDELAELKPDSDAGPVVSALLGRSARRLRVLCASLLYRRYRRLALPPTNLDAEEMLGAVVERLLRALREVRPRDVRGFFALASRHMYWELNDLARRLDEQATVMLIAEESIQGPGSSDSSVSPNARRMLEAIEAIPEEEREVFNLVRLQGMTHAEVAGLLGVSLKTVQRRLNRGLVFLSKALSDLRPSV